MKTNGNAKLLRILIGETDKVKHSPLYEIIIYRAMKHKLAGATVLRGIMGYGANNILRKHKTLALSIDLPVVIEIVDEEKKINVFVEELNRLIESTNVGALITIENIDVIMYKPSK